ncbi:MAG: hypothetical protein PHU05_05055 [Bacilli bacterium]|nr:hypothetical protein [Bacilli bacterium]
MVDTISIDEFRSRLFFRNNNYEGYKIVQDKKSVIHEGETGMLLVELPPKVFPSGKFEVHILSATIMEQKGLETFKDNEVIKIVITKQDFKFLSEVLKVKKDDVLYVIGNNYKSKQGFIISGRKWFVKKDAETKKKEFEAKEISLE